MKSDLVYRDLSEKHLIDGVFFDLCVPMLDIEMEDSDESCYVVLPEGFESPKEYDGFKRARIEGGDETNQTIKRVQICSDHTKVKQLKSLHLEYYPGPYSDLIPNNTIGNNFGVLHPFRQQIEQDTQLKGAHFIEPVIYGHHKKKAPKISIFVAQGLIERVPHILREGVKNGCRKCGFGPLYCEQCGDVIYTCPNCRSRSTSIVSSTERIEEASIVFPAYDEKKLVFLGRSWDGSDFCRGANHGSLVITKRALDWFLSVHAMPLFARPVKVYTEGMSDEQLQWLKRAKG